MKKRIVVGMLLALVLLLSACATPEGVQTANGKTDTASEEQGGLFENLIEEVQEESKDEQNISSHYYQVSAQKDSANPKNNTFIYVNAEEVITITGFERIDPYMYNGVAVAETTEGEDVLIDKHGNIIASMKDYSYIYRIITYSDYFKVTNRETGLEGVVDCTGKVILPCEYEDITFPWDRSGRNSFVIMAQKENVVSFYTKEGIKLAETTANEDADAFYHKVLNEDYAYIVVHYDRSNREWFSEKTGEPVFVKDDVWDITGIDETNRIASRKSHETNGTRMFILNEDFTIGAEMIGWESYGYTGEIVADGRWLLIGRDEWKLFDDNGQVVKDFEVETKGALDQDGNMVCFSLYEDKCVLWDRDGKEIRTIDGVKFSYFTENGYFCGKPVTNGTVSETVNLYNFKGEIVHGNIKSVFRQIGYGWQSNGESKEYGVYEMEMADGSKYYKTENGEEFHKAIEGETFAEVYMGYPVFINGEEKIIRDDNLEEIFRISSNASVEYMSGCYMEELNGVKKYYSYKGELLAEAQE